LCCSALASVAFRDPAVGAARKGGLSRPTRLRLIDAPRSGYDRGTMARDVLALLDALDLERYAWRAITGEVPCPLFATTPRSG